MDNIKQLENELLNSSHITEERKRQLVLDYIYDVNDVKELDRILNRLFEERLKNKLYQVFDNRNLPFKTQVDIIVNMILSSPDEFKDKMKFIELLSDNKKLFNPSRIVCSKRVKPLNSLVDEQFQKNKTFNNVRDNIFNWRYGGGTTQTGKGEAFLMLFGNNILPSNYGDICIKNTNIEVKDGYARPRGQKGYNAPCNGFKILKNNMVERMNDFSDNSTDWNFKSALCDVNKKLKKLNDRNFVFDVYSEVFKEIYTDCCNTVIVDKWLDKMLNKNGTFKDNALELLTAMQLEYYKYIEEFDSFLFLNTKKMKYQYIQNEEVFINNSENYTIIPFNWNGKDSRDSVNRICLK